MDVLQSDQDPSLEQICWELAGLFNGLSESDVEEVIAKNVPPEMIRFVSRYGRDFSEVHELNEVTESQLPNLVLMGYLIRLLEERLVRDAT